MASADPRLTALHTSDLTQVPRMRRARPGLVREYPIENFVIVVFHENPEESTLPPAGPLREDLIKSIESEEFTESNTEEIDRDLEAKEIQHKRQAARRAASAQSRVNAQALADRRREKQENQMPSSTPTDQTARSFPAAGPLEAQAQAVRVRVEKAEEALAEALLDQEKIDELTKIRKASKADRQEAEKETSDKLQKALDRQEKEATAAAEKAISKKEPAATKKRTTRGPAKRK